MTQHPSLRSSGKSKQHRSVLKRFERLRHMEEKGEWEEGRSIFGLPKIKILKFKIKKEKAAAEETTEAAAGAEGNVPKEEAKPLHGKEGTKREEKGAVKDADSKGRAAKEKK